MLVLLPTYGYGAGSVDLFYDQPFLVKDIELRSLATLLQKRRWERNLGDNRRSLIVAECRLEEESILRRDVRDVEVPYRADHRRSEGHDIRA